MPVRYLAVSLVDELVMKRLGVSDPAQVVAAVGDDFRWIQSRYRGPDLQTLPDGTTEGLWGERWSTRHNPDGVFQDIVYQPYQPV